MDARAFLSMLLACIIALAGVRGTSGCGVLPQVDFASDHIACPNNVKNIHGCADLCYKTADCIAFLWAPSEIPNAIRCTKSVMDSTYRTIVNGTRITVITGYADCRYLFDPHR